jgi:hypothetical protein
MGDLEITQKALPDPNELYNQGKQDLGNLSELKVGSGSSIFYTDKEGSRWGHILFDSAPAWIKIDGSAQFKTSAGDVLLSTSATDGNFINIINTALNTSSKTILTDFTFESADYAGAFKAGNPTWSETTGLITGGSGVLINARGILGANAGVATFTLDATTGNATFAGTLAAPNGTLGTITAGTITGATIQTAVPGLATGSAVVITGGMDQIIKLYHNTTEVGSISGLQTVVGAEVDFLKIYAQSGRFLSLRGSEIACDGDFVQSGTHSLGQQAQPWDSLWAKSVVAYGSGAKFSINGADGQSNSFGIVTNIRSQTTQGRLEKKYRTFTFTKGLVTGIAGESSWQDCGPMNP